MSSFRLNNDEFKAMLNGAEGPVTKALTMTANRVKNSARRRCPVDRGKLRASIAFEIVQENGIRTARVGTNTKYAVFVHEGTGLWSKTKPGPIRPKNKKVLRWPKINKNYRQTGGPRRYKNGKTFAYVFSKQSAGSPGRPFLADALEEVLGQS